LKCYSIFKQQSYLPANRERPPLDRAILCEIERFRELKNKLKSLIKLAKIHAKIDKSCKNTIHLFACDLAKNYSKIKIEERSVKAFLKNHKLQKYVVLARSGSKHARPIELRSGLDRSSRNGSTQ
jgi:hypothetical protein